MCQTKPSHGKRGEEKSFSADVQPSSLELSDLGPVGGGSDTTGAPSVRGDVTNQLAAQERTLCTHVGKMFDK